jgi:LacI family transcriptional regulator
MKRPATIVDVANRAGVSLGTVSNVLNRRVSVRKETKEQVETAIRELDFTPSMIASGMRRQRSNVIGLCVPFTTFQNFSLLADAVERISAAAGYELMQVYSRQNPTIELERIERLLAFRVGGVILVPSLKPEAALDRLARTGTPTVILNRPIEDERFDQVMVDHREAVREVVDGLIDRGHKKIVLASQFPTLSVTRWRVKAMKETVKRRRMAVEVVALTTGATEVEFFERLAPHLTGETGPLALICSNSLVTTWALRMARSLGRQSPADFSLVALDDPEWADIVTPRLSAVHQPTEAVARKAMDVLISRMNRTAGKPRRVLIAADVKFRDSVRGFSTRLFPHRP